MAPPDGEHRRERPGGLFGPSGADQRKAQDGCQNGQQWLAARREQLAIYSTGQCGMVLRTATGGLRPARPMRAPTTNLSGLSGHLPYKGRHNDERPTNYDERQALTGTIVGAVPTGGPPRTIGYTPIRSMWHGFATCDLRPATGAPYKGRPRPTNLSGLLGHLPYKGRHNDERIAEGDKPRATNH